MRFRQIRRDYKLLGEILIEQGFINEEQLDKGLTVYKERNTDTPIGRILIELGLVKEEDVLGAVTTQYRIPYIPLDRYNINPDAIDMVPANVALKYLFMPIDKIGPNLVIAMSDPLNYGLLAEIESIVKCNVQTVISTAAVIMKTIDEYYYHKNKYENNLFPLMPWDN